MVSIIGGESYFKQQKHLSRPVDIMLLPPGRLMDYLNRKKINLSQVQFVVLDEADRLFRHGLC